MGVPYYAGIGCLWCWDGSICFVPGWKKCCNLGRRVHTEGISHTFLSLKGTHLLCIPMSAL